MNHSQGSTSWKLHYLWVWAKALIIWIFLADLSALKAEEVTRARPNSSKPVPRSDSLLLHMLKQGEVPYAHCAWCKEALKTRNMLEEHY